MATLTAWLSGVLFGAGKGLNVNELTQLPDVDAVIEASKTAPQFIFKHSTTCPISAGAHRRVSEYLRDHADTASSFHLVKVIESRPVSNAIAERLGVVHQSPQLIEIKNGEAVWDTSHGGIDGDAISQALEST